MSAAHATLAIERPAAVLLGSVFHRLDPGSFSLRELLKGGILRLKILGVHASGKILTEDVKYGLAATRLIDAPDPDFRRVAGYRRIDRAQRFAYRLTVLRCLNWRFAVVRPSAGRKTMNELAFVAEGGRTGPRIAVTMHVDLCMRSK